MATCQRLREIERVRDGNGEMDATTEVGQPGMGPLQSFWAELSNTPRFNNSSLQYPAGIRSIYQYLG